MSQAEGGMPPGNEPRKLSAVEELVGQTVELRERALTLVAKASQLVAKKEAELAETRGEQRQVCRAAEHLGIDREEIARAAGVTASTIGSWVREEQPG